MALVVGVVRICSGLITYICISALQLTWWVIFGAFSSLWAQVFPFFQWEHCVGYWLEYLLAMAFSDDWRGDFPLCFYIPSIFETRHPGYGRSGMSSCSEALPFMTGMCSGCLGLELIWPPPFILHMLFSLCCLRLSCEQLPSAATQSLGINQTKTNQNTTKQNIYLAYC